MSPDVKYAIASAAVAVVLVFAGWAWRRWVITPDMQDQRDQGCYRPRHGHSWQERIPSPDELSRWREDWTDAELAAMRRDQAEPYQVTAILGSDGRDSGRTVVNGHPFGRRDWDFHAWQIEQEQWLEARRREAHEYALVLKTGAWADPWWIYR